MTELRIEEQPPEFTEWIADQDLDYKEKELWNFHRWMRQKTGLGSGSIVDYRKYVAEYLDENGELQDLNGQTMTSHKSAAVSKFQEFQNSAFYSTTTTEGGSSE